MAWIFKGRNETTGRPYFMWVRVGKKPKKPNPEGKTGVRREFTTFASAVASAIEIAEEIKEENLKSAGAERE